jgi:hypothetical protein
LNILFLLSNLRLASSKALAGRLVTLFHLFINPSSQSAEQQNDSQTNQDHDANSEQHIRSMKVKAMINSHEPKAASVRFAR